MNSNDRNNDDKGFVLQLIMRAEQKAKEYAETLHEIRHLERQAEQTKEYIEQLNNFIMAEGQKPVSIKETLPPGSGFGKPGNRTKGLPLRKMEWEGMTINDIISTILNRTPEVIYHHTEVIPQVYEIDTDSDLRKVLPNMRSAMQKGARDGLWDRASRGKFKAKEVLEQKKLISV